MSSLAPEKFGSSLFNEALNDNFLVSLDLALFWQNLAADQSWRHVN